MGFGKTLKKIGKAAINPITAFQGNGASAGTPNPYGPVDLSFLNDTSKLDFLKDPNTFKVDPSKYSFLTNPSSTFASTYKGPNYGRSDSIYNDLLGVVNAPSSVDQVRSGIDSETMKNLLSGIDQDTAKSVGSLKSDFLDRGLSGPGMASDIEGNALAEAYGLGDKNKSTARLDYAGKELDRLKAAEDARRAAATARYETAGAQDTQENQTRAAGAQADVAGRQARDLSYADILKGGSDNSSQALQLLAQLINQRDLGKAGQATSLFNAGQQNQAATKTPSYLDSILRNIQVSPTLAF